MHRCYHYQLSPLSHNYEWTIFLFISSILLHLKLMASGILYLVIDARHPYYRTYWSCKMLHRIWGTDHLSNNIENKRHQIEAENFQLGLLLEILWTTIKCNKHYVYFKFQNVCVQTYILMVVKSEVELFSSKAFCMWSLHIKALFKPQTWHSTLLLWLVKLLVREHFPLFLLKNCLIRELIHFRNSLLRILLLLV